MFKILKRGGICCPNFECCFIVLKLLVARVSWALTTETSTKASFHGTGCFKVLSHEAIFSTSCNAMMTRALRDKSRLNTCHTLRKVNDLSTFSATRNVIFLYERSCEEGFSTRNFVRNFPLSGPMPLSCKLQKKIASCKTKSLPSPCSARSARPIFIAPMPN